MQFAGSVTSAWSWGEGGRDMHHFAVPHSILTSELAGVRDGRRREEHPVCPKPRRPVAPVPEFLCPLSCKHSHSSYEGGSKVLDIQSGKRNDGRESVSIGCPPSCYCGSPPSRSDNPLVHDVEFVHQMELFSPFQRAELSEKHGFTSPS
uniref:Zinc finger CCCH domain-containing protein 7B n=1 Tax=Anthurium amnicola TaxID=1678845 RepID=A0A1D1XVW5_9ARAE